ncbi:MAG: phosphatase PAP2 family protein [Planctomycetaceae bacterium]|nr:phosphatase PAP2 family protein [Planctomycetaceae bacterium]
MTIFTEIVTIRRLSFQKQLEIDNMPLLRVVILLCSLPVTVCAQSLECSGNFPPPTFHTPLPFSETFNRFGNRERDRIFSDYGNLYQKNNIGNYGLALLGAGIMANTKIDSNFQNWYNRHIECNFTNEFSEFSKWFGEGKIFIPITVASALSYRFLQEKYGRTNNPRPFFEFTDRTMRGYFVGFPTLLAVQLITGGDRPRDGTSYWHPFQNDHGASGHAFIGAIPFITAAHMTDKLYLKGLFYTLSIVPAWSRVNDNAHYLSQALLGWYIGYLSVRAVSATEGTKLPRGMVIFPVVENNAAGIGLYYRY